MANRTGGRSGGGEPGDEASSGRTQRLPRMLVEPSSMEVDVVLEPDAALSALGAEGDADAATQPTMTRPQVIVLEEKPIGLCDSLARLGFLVRPAKTGVEAMSLVADRAPNAVVTGPGDAERRRVLVGALRLRFPAVPVVLVLAKVDEAALESARREGAHAVLSWPLPQAHDIYAAIPGSPMVKSQRRSTSAPKTLLVPPTAALPPMPSSIEQQDLLSADASAEWSAVGSPVRSSPTPGSTKTLVAPHIDVSAQLPRSSPRPAGVERRPPTAPEDLATLDVARVNVPLTREGDENADTSPGKPAADLQDALAPRGDIKDVLLAVSPFLWGLDDCARYLEDLHAHHVAGADVHARTVRLVARLLAQVQARVDEL